MNNEELFERFDYEDLYKEFIEKNRNQSKFSNPSNISNHRNAVDDIVSRIAQAAFGSKERTSFEDQCIRAGRTISDRIKAFSEEPLAKELTLVIALYLLKTGLWLVLRQSSELGLEMNDL